jgi:hypothetical protein
VDLETGELQMPTQKIKWKKRHLNFHDDEILEIVKNKSKEAAWFASNCHTHSKRENLVDELGKFIKVDIYGKCGSLE